MPIYPRQERTAIVFESPPMASNIPMIVQAVLEWYPLPLESVHGVVHWARVLENGRRLSGETGANIEVVELFAVLHDSRRLNEGTRPVSRLQEEASNDRANQGRIDGADCRT